MGPVWEYGRPVGAGRGHGFVLLSWTSWSWGNVCPACARRATFVFSILALAPSLSSPAEVPLVDRTLELYHHVPGPGGPFHKCETKHSCIIAYHTHIIRQSCHSRLTKIGPVIW